MRYPASEKLEIIQLVEKNGFLSPAQARRVWDDAMSTKAAA